MERKTVSQAQIYVRDAVNRAAQLAGRKEYAAAVTTLLPVVKRNLDVPLLFDRIREYEIQKLRKQGGGAKVLSLLGALFKAPIIFVLSIVDPYKAVAMCETSLAGCVDNGVILSLLISAGNAIDAPWITVSALNTMCKLHPGNSSRMRQLADAMQRNGQGIEALKIHQELIKKSPAASLAEQAELRSAMALASIERGKFNDRKSTGANTADAEEAKIQLLLDGTIHDAAQAQVLIDRFVFELKRTDSVDMRRKLADAYMVAGKYEEAYEEYSEVAKKLGVMDPLLDKLIEKAYLAQLQVSIDALKANPEAYDNPEQQIADLQKEYNSYRWRHTLKRAQGFVNDMQLQFDLAVLQFESDMIDDAVETFKRVADNPQKRRDSLVYLGRCALLRNELPQAISYLNDAINEMSRMDKYKREALYYLGCAKEASGDKAGAMECYRQIHASMSNYRDVPQRMAAISDNAAAVAADTAGEAQSE